MRDRIEFFHCDACYLIERFIYRKTAAFFVDPPYTAAGKLAGRRLYRHNKVDHRALFAALRNAAGPVLMTYDDSDEVRKLARATGFRVEAVAMKNTHHNVVHELALSNIGSCLDQPLPLFDRRNMKYFAEHLGILHDAR